MFAYAGLFTIFDAFRTKNVNVRASYTISDMLSRENACIDQEYIAGLNSLLALLTQSDYPTIIRVTVVQYVEDEELNELVWSAVDGGTGIYIKPYTQATLTEEMDQYIPIMADGDQNIIVETWSGFVPIFEFGLDSFYFENRVVSRKRWAPQLVWDTGTTPGC
ncbi:hypothetical protein [Pseudoruegeria sp. HB172150]|uniref:hypothetical protein n=1 Tax=Pseudoruegeria sp. HB172150 TaxID=2721164 RepID=UPI001C13148C|nr:hypothetical protein [Pseudoruegeria sp. HB172150]